MKGTYPARLSVAELRQELAAYLEYRRGRVKAGTLNMDRIMVRQFLDWLELGRAGRPDYEELAREYIAEIESE